MAASLKLKSFSSRSQQKTDSEEEENGTVTMLEVFHGTTREKIVLQQLIVATRLPHHMTDRTELGAHYEKLHFQLSKHYILDVMTGLLLIYPSCLLHVVESSREVLLSVLRDLTELQQQAGCASLEESKVVFMAHNPDRRLFQQWSYKVMDADQSSGDSGAEGLEEEEEETTESLVCTVLSALQNLGERHQTSPDAPPGADLDQTAGLMVSQQVVHKLLARDDLLSPQQHLQMYDSPLDISMDFGQATRSRRLTTV